MNLGNQRDNSAICFVGERAMDSCVEAAGGKVGFDARINGLRVVLVKPRIQLPQLLLTELVDRALDLPYRV